MLGDPRHQDAKCLQWLLLEIDICRGNGMIIFTGVGVMIFDDSQEPLSF